MLRGWKSASCSGLPALSAATGAELVAVAGIPPVTKIIPMLSNQRLRSIQLIAPPSQLLASPSISLRIVLLLYRILSLVKVG